MLDPSHVKIRCSDSREGASVCDFSSRIRGALKRRGEARVSRLENDQMRCRDGGSDGVCAAVKRFFALARLSF
jgi:hypothetical protein